MAKAKKKVTTAKIPWAKAPEIKGAQLIGHAFIKEHCVLGNSGHFLYLTDDSHSELHEDIAAEMYWFVLGRPSRVPMPAKTNWRKSFTPAPAKKKASK